MSSNEIQAIIVNGHYDPHWVKGLQDFPDIDILSRNLDELMNTDKSAMSAEEIKDFFFRKIILFPNSSHTIPASVFNNQTFWRTRKNVGTQEDINTIHPFTYPKSCTANGRANMKDQPVFYCASTRAASLFECRPEVDEIIYLSDWSLTCDRDITTRFLLPESISEKNLFHMLAHRHLEEIKTMAQSWGLDKAPQLELITRFLGNAFVSETYPYSLSSWLANDILFGKQAVDMMYYPSIMTQQVSCNIAIVPAFVDRYLHPNRVFKMQVLERTDRNIRPVILEVGIITGNTICWHDTTDDDMAYFQE